MKQHYLYSSRYRAFWVLIPMSIILTLSIKHNSNSTNVLKLYPLIIFTIGAIIFTFVYYFRFICMSYGEIKHIGKFSSRDSATINEGKTLVVEHMQKGVVSIKLYGNEGYNPDIKWLTNEAGEGGDICLFRGKVYGNEKVTAKILTFFGIGDSADIDAILNTDGYKKSYENVTVSTCTENENKQIRIRFDKTV